MATKRQRIRAGEFIVTEEPGAISRDNGYLAEGQNLEAGTLLAESDGGDLVAWESDACAGILFAGCNATAARQRVTIVARLASVNFELLSFGDAEEGAARDALQAIRLTVRSDHLIADTGGGGGGDYVVGAVHLSADGSGGGEFLEYENYPVADSPYLIHSSWIKAYNLPSPPNPANDPGFQLFFFDEVNFGTQAMGVDNAVPGFIVELANSDDSQQVTFKSGGNPIPFTITEWFNILIYVRSNLGSGLKICQVYVNDALVPMSMQVDLGDDSAFDMGFNDKTFGLPYYGANFNQDMCDPQTWIGQQIDFSIEANRRLFISGDGKPVDPAVAAAALGAPTNIFSGDAADWAAQATSQGFELSGTLTNATTSPSD